MYSHAEKVVFSYNLQRGKLASFWRNLAFVTTTAGKVHAIGKRKTQKKDGAKQRACQKQENACIATPKKLFFRTICKGAN